MTAEDVDEQVIPFDERSEELLGMVAAQAGVSLETAMLYEEIRNLFEGFVKASVEAIESRDPTTSGHSRRVADLTVELAKVVDRETTGPYAGAGFTPEDLRELEYASLLHDFGKIGVREKVLVKAKKLYDDELGLLRMRFDYVTRTIEADVLARKVRALESGAGEPSSRRSTASSPSAGETSTGVAVGARRERADGACGGDFARIEAIARETYTDLRGEVRRLLRGERGRLSQRQARVAHADGVRRDPLARRAHVPVPLADPLGQSVPPRPHHRGRAPRAAQRHRVPEPPSRRRRSRCSRR